MNTYYSHASSGPLIAKRTGICTRANSGKVLFWEVLVALGVLALLLLFVVLPMMARAHVKINRVACPNSLKQIGLAFRVWSGDNDDRFPMEVSFTNGGSMEYVTTPQAFQHFKVMAAELGQSPKIVVCPEDRMRGSAEDFYANFCNSNLSYFVNVNATARAATDKSILCGDRNISPIGDCLLKPNTNSVLFWGTNLHNRNGYILYGDGTVDQTQSFRSSGETLSIP